MLAFEHVCKEIEGTKILKDVSFSLCAGEIVALVGKSGAGKTTLLHTAAGLLVPSSGRVLLEGEDIFALPEEKRRLYVAKHVGMVFQSFHVFSHLTVAENIYLPFVCLGQEKKEVSTRLGVLLEKVGLGGFEERVLGTLSGGQKQRVALVRALIHAPKLVLADEPTGNLDETAASTVTTLLMELAKEEGTAVLLVTHEAGSLAHAQRVLPLQEGILTTR